MSTAYAITLSDGSTVTYRPDQFRKWRRVNNRVDAESEHLAGILPANTYTDADEAACFDLLKRATEAL